MTDGVMRDAPDWMGVAEHVAQSCSYGDMLTHEWIVDQLGIQKPEYGSQEDFDAFNFAYMQSISSLSKYLLEEHQLAVQNVRGKGYRVVPPDEQVDAAKKHVHQEMHRAIRRYASHLTNIRYDELSSESQRRRDDEAAKLTQMKQMMRRGLTN